MKVGLEKQLKGLSDWFSQNKLTVNTDKMKVIFKTVKIFLLLFSKIQILSARKKSNIGYLF